MGYKGNLRNLIRRAKEGSRGVYKDKDFVITRLLQVIGDYHLIFCIYVCSFEKPIIWCTNRGIWMETISYSKENVKFLYKCLYEPTNISFVENNDMGLEDYNLEDYYCFDEI